jgi:hypothetical protein
MFMPPLSPLPDPCGSMERTVTVAVTSVPLVKVSVTGKLLPGVSGLAMQTLKREHWRDGFSE